MHSKAFRIIMQNNCAKGGGFPCCSVTLPHSGDEMFTLGLRRSSGVTHMITQRSSILVHSSVGSVAPTFRHVPYVRHVATQVDPTHGIIAIVGRGITAAEPANKAFTGLWW